MSNYFYHHITQQALRADGYRYLRSFGSYKMELNRKLCAMRRKLSQRYWLDDSLGCWLLMWYCPFNFPFNFHYNFQFYFQKFS